jgi:hypothetical protein
MKTLSLEAAKAYKLAGGPQDEWPQMAWTASSLFSHCRWHPEAPPNVGYQHIEAVPEGGPTKIAKAEWYAAPDYFTALAWFEEHKHWWCGHTTTRRWYAHHDSMDVDLSTDNPDDLILQMCQRLQQAGEGQCSHNWEPAELCPQCCIWRMYECAHCELQGCGHCGWGVEAVRSSGVTS